MLVVSKIGFTLPKQVGSFLSGGIFEKTQQMKWYRVQSKLEVMILLNFFISIGWWSYGDFFYLKCGLPVHNKERIGDKLWKFSEKLENRLCGKVRIKQASCIYGLGGKEVKGQSVCTLNDKIHTISENRFKSGYCKLSLGLYSPDYFEQEETLLVIH